MIARLVAILCARCTVHEERRHCGASCIQVVGTTRWRTLTGWPRGSLSHWDPCKPAQLEDAASHTLPFFAVGGGGAAFELMITAATASPSLLFHATADPLVMSIVRHCPPPWASRLAITACSFRLVEQMAAKRACFVTCEETDTGAGIRFAPRSARVSLHTGPENLAAVSTCRGLSHECRDCGIAMKSNSAAKTQRMSTQCDKAM
jgi:hypothetical protein